MQMNEKQTLLAGAAALALIVFGALFWIAPVWQFGYAPAAYQPPVLPAQAEPAPEPTREEQGPVNINTASAEELMRLPRHWAGKSGSHSGGPRGKRPLCSAGRPDPREGNIPAHGAAVGK